MTSPRCSASAARRASVSPPEAPAAHYRPSDSRGRHRRRGGAHRSAAGGAWFLYVGGLNPHKHVDAIVAAHARIVRAQPGDAAVAGARGTGGPRRVSRRSAAPSLRPSPRTERRRTFAGPAFVSDDDLRHLYTGALALRARVGVAKASACPRSRPPPAALRSLPRPPARCRSCSTAAASSSPPADVDAAADGDASPCSTTSPGERRWARWRASGRRPLAGTAARGQTLAAHRRGGRLMQRVLMLTTFYPPYSFGGDAVDMQALGRRAGPARLRGDRRARRGRVSGAGAATDAQPRHQPEPGVEVIRPAQPRSGELGLLLTHQTGHPVVHGARLRRLCAERRFDTVVFDNVSLMGGPAVFALCPGGRPRVRGHRALVDLSRPTCCGAYDQQPCDERRCLRCTLHHRRPPQLWRYTGADRTRVARTSTCSIARSEFSRRKHREYGFDAADGSGAGRSSGRLTRAGADRAAAHPPVLSLCRPGRAASKGLADVLPLFMRDRGADLVIAGTGSAEAKLRAATAASPARPLARLRARATSSRRGTATRWRSSCRRPPTRRSASWSSRPSVTARRSSCEAWAAAGADRARRGRPGVRQCRRARPRHANPRRDPRVATDPGGRSRGLLPGELERGSGGAALHRHGRRGPAACGSSGPASNGGAIVRAILTYHSIDSSGSPISVSPAAFRRHIRHALSAGIRIVSLEDLLAAADAAADTVALTFDDGFVNVAKEAIPVLAEHGLPATMFVPTACVGKTNEWVRKDHHPTPELSLLDWDALEARCRNEASPSGRIRERIQPLTDLPARHSSIELAGAARDIAERLGSRPAGWRIRTAPCPATSVARPGTSIHGRAPPRSGVGNGPAARTAAPGHVVLRTARTVRTVGYPGFRAVGETPQQAAANARGTQSLCPAMTPPDVSFVCPVCRAGVWQEASAYACRPCHRRIP